jgi:hypothetical protein
MDRRRRWCRQRGRRNFRHNNAARFGDNSHGQKFRSRLLGGPADAVLVLVSPLEYLVGVDPVLSRNSCNRRSGNKCRLDDTALLRRCTMNPFRRATDGNLNRLAHKAIVSLIAPPVYTARTGRLRLCASEPWKTDRVLWHRGKTLPPEQGLAIPP